MCPYIYCHDKGTEGSQKWRVPLDVGKRCSLTDRASRKSPVGKEKEYEKVLESSIDKNIKADLLRAASSCCMFAETRCKYQRSTKAVEGSIN
jgi:hypothetical protein